MFLLRYILRGALAVIVLWWPITYLINFFFHKRRITKLTKNMLTLDDYPIIGCGLRLVGKDNEGIIDVLKDILFKYKTPFIAWFGPKSVIIIDNPDDIQAIVNSTECLEKSFFYSFFNRLLDAIFATPVHTWRVQRKQVLVSFNNQVIWTLLPIFNEKAGLFLRNIGRHIGKGEFDVVGYSANCTFDVLGATMLGTNMKIQEGGSTDHMDALAEWLSIVARRMMNIFLHSNIIYKKTQLYQDECDWFARTEILPTKVIAEKMLKYLEDNKNNNESTNEDDDFIRQFEKPQIFVDQLIRLRAKGKITDEQLLAEVNSLTIGGQDSSAFTVTMTILMLAIHPKVDQRVIDELNEVLGDQPIDADITVEQANKLAYLEQVMQETLRMFTPAPFIMRHCSKDLKMANFTIPENTEVLISLMTLHRRKDIWGDDADEYNPDHFSKEACSKRHPYAYMAFSKGSRNCIGQRFALMSVKIILARLFRKYRFSTHMSMEDIRFKFRITLKPSNGIFVGVEERT